MAGEATNRSRNNEISTGTVSLVTNKTRLESKSDHVKIQTTSKGILKHSAHNSDSCHPKHLDQSLNIVKVGAEAANAKLQDPSCRKVHLPRQSPTCTKTTKLLLSDAEAVASAALQVKAATKIRKGGRRIIRTKSLTQGSRSKSFTYRSSKSPPPLQLSSLSTHSSDSFRRSERRSGSSRRLRVSSSHSPDASRRLVNRNNKTDSMYSFENSPDDLGPRQARQRSDSFDSQDSGDFYLRHSPSSQHTRRRGTKRQSPRNRSSMSYDSDDGSTTLGSTHNRNSPEFRKRKKGFRHIVASRNQMAHFLFVLGTIFVISFSVSYLGTRTKPITSNSAHIASPSNIVLTPQQMQEIQRRRQQHQQQRFEMVDSAQHHFSEENENHHSIRGNDSGNISSKGKPSAAIGNDTDNNLYKSHAHIASRAPVSVKGVTNSKKIQNNPGPRANFRGSIKSRKQKNNPQKSVKKSGKSPLRSRTSRKNDVRIPIQATPNDEAIYSLPKAASLRGSRKQGKANDRRVSAEYSAFQQYSHNAPTCDPLAADDVTFTLVTQLSLNRLWMMEHHCSRWITANQPNSENLISIAVFTGNDATASVEKIREDLTQLGCPVDLVTVQTVTGYSEEEYPVNTLRNVALSAVKTSHVVYVDVDFWESEDLYDNLQSHRQFLSENSKAALILPAFQLNRQCRDWRECPEKNVPRMPHNKEELLDRMVEHKSTAFDPTNVGGHGSTRYSEWLDQEPDELLKIECVHSNRYEPYLVFRYCRDLPPFQEAFTGYGKNKMTWVMQLRRTGYELYQLGGSFVVHYPHLDSKARMHWNGGEGGVQLKKPKNLEEVDLMDFKRGQIDKTFVDFKEWLEKTIPDQTKLFKCPDALDDDQKLWIVK